MIFIVIVYAIELLRSNCEFDAPTSRRDQFHTDEPSSNLVLVAPDFRLPNLQGAILVLESHGATETFMAP